MTEHATRDDVEAAEDSVRESFCDSCKGVEFGSPCYLEDKCDGFKKAVAEQLAEWEVTDG